MIKTLSETSASGLTGGKHPGYAYPMRIGSVKIVTFGCQMNDLDSRKLFSELSRAGYEPTHDDQAADLIILNTCSVRRKAEEKALSLLGRLRALKKKKPGLIIAVAGCVAQQEGRALIERMPWIDLVVGTHQLHRVPELVARARADKQQLVDTAQARCIPSMDIVPEHDFLQHPHRAYINIMQGCDNFCSYCIVPTTRGREVSREYVNIMDEVRVHAGRGVKEVFLLGQNVNSYMGGVTFPELLRGIHAIDGIERIRFTTSHPKDVSPDLVACFGELPKLCSNLHLPFQAGGDVVLKAMNRHYTFEGYLKLVADLRAARPDLAFSADVMVGFPSETHADFERTLALIEAVRFDVLYSFKYSPRPGTAAAGMVDTVSAEEKQERLSILQDMQRIITLENNKARVGQVYDVLVDGVSGRYKDQVQGRSTHNAIVNFRGSSDLIGTIVPVRVMRGNQNSLTGEMFME